MNNILRCAVLFKSSKLSPHKGLFGDGGYCNMFVTCKYVDLFRLFVFFSRRQSSGHNFVRIALKFYKYVRIWCPTNRFTFGISPDPDPDTGIFVSLCSSISPQVMTGRVWKKSDICVACISFNLTGHFRDLDHHPYLAINLMSFLGCNGELVRYWLQICCTWSAGKVFRHKMRF